MIARLVSTAKGIVGRRRAESELDEELRFHIEMETQANLQHGMNPSEARRAALRDLGGIQHTRQAVKDIRFTFLDGAWLDVRHALRALAAARGFSASAILALALGIGGSTLVFGVVEVLLVRPLPYAEASRLAVVTPNVHHWTDYEAIRDRNRVFDDTAGYSERSANIIVAGEPVRGVVASVTGNLLQVLGVRTVVGRGFSADDLRSGSDHVAVITDAFWQKHFGGSKDVLGQTVWADGVRRTVVGVLPADFRTVAEMRPGGEASGDRTVFLLVPAMFWDGVRNPTATDHWHGVTVVGRLRAGISLKRASSDIAVILNRAMTGVGAAGLGGPPPLFALCGMRQAVAGDLAARLRVLSCAVGLLLLVACANVGNLFLVRLQARRRELALRRAIGASTPQLLRSVLAEATLVSAAGGTAGVFLAWAGVQVVKAYGTSALPLLSGLSLNAPVLAFAGLLSLGVAFAVSLAPAAQLVRGDLSQAMRASAREQRLPFRLSLPSFLVVNQVLMSVVLVVVSALLARDLANLMRADLGFRPEGVLTAEISLDRARYWGRGIAFFDELLQRLEALDGVEAAALAAIPPGREVVGVMKIQAEGTTPQFIQVNAVSEDYFRVMGVPVLAGGAFPKTASLQTPPVILANHAFARDHWANPAHAVGKAVKPSGEGRPMTIVGVAGDTREMGTGLMFQPRLYRSFRQEVSIRQVAILLRARNGDASSLAAPLIGVLRSADPTQPLYNISTLARIVNSRFARQRLVLVMMVVFASLTLMLAAFGVHGVMAYAVALEKHEIGVRLALGAGRPSILLLTLRRGVRLVAAGVALGLPVALMLRWLAVSEFVGSGESDTVMTSAALGLVCAAALSGCLFPALTAMRMDPVAVLRSE